MKNTIFTGMCTALVTPMDENGAVDYEAFGRLINWQIQQGINALVVCGTTGESSTLSDAEHRQVLKFALDVAKGRVPMIAGTGSNDAAYAIELFDGLCIALQLWLGDEEFPARLRFLWDENALMYLKYETMYFARALLLRRLEKIMQNA